MFPEETQNNFSSNNLLKDKRIITSSVIVFFLICFYIFVLSAPRNFPAGTLYDLTYGQTLSSVSTDLENKGIIRSEFWFKSFVYVFSLGKVKVVAGDYNLPQKQSVVRLAWRISHGSLDIVPLKVTIPEGMNSTEIADILSHILPSFDKENFVRLVKSENLEGYIFPDTYFFMPNTTPEEIIKIMNDNFNEKMKSLEADIKSFGKSLSDVIKMASIIEEEARTDESRRTVAGILWKRISMKMALQVDSSFKYINGKTTATLSTVDLKIDSPYNSYTHRGLPPTPISNPGLRAISDTIHPIKTPYLYFLTDNDGNMHYAATFEEHVANKQKYLR